MASRSNNGPPTKDDLFTGLTFWLSRQVPMRSYFEESMKRRGATLVTNESHADMRIVDDARKNLPVGEHYYSYKFVAESMKNNRLEGRDKYAVGLSSAADRPVGSMNVAAKRTRKPFTREDDQILYNWLEPYRQSGGSWKGNKIYEQLARKHPQHPMQSWRARYLFIVEKCTKMTVTEHIDPFAISDNEDTAEPQHRSPKRRRLNRSQPASPQPLPTVVPPTAPSVRSYGTATIHNTSARIQPQKKAVTKSGTSTSVRKDSARRHTPENLTENVTEFESKDSLVPVMPSASAAGSRANKARKEDKHDAERIANKTLIDQVSHVSKNHSRLIFGNVDAKEHPSQLQVDGTNEPLETVINLGKFTIEEAQELYRAVPDIHNVEPQNLDQSWENMVQEKRSQHTVAEWRLFYKSTILPEYMRQKHLLTKEDLDDHVHDVLAEVQYQMSQRQGIKEEPASTTANETHEELEQNQEDEIEEEEEEEAARMSPSHVSRHSCRRESARTDAENDISIGPREASPVLKPQTILKAVEIKQNGNLIAQESIILQPQLSQPRITQSLIISPKKKLFGRTLDALMISSHSQDPKTTMNPISANEASFGTASTTSALAYLTSQSVTSSKRPPESGQLPPKSVTTSQEESVAHGATDQEQSETNVLDTLLNIGGNDVSPVFSANSPTVDVGWEGNEEDNPISSSPALSDTGSEYVEFDTGPPRSQLWELDPDETREEPVVNDNREEPDDDNFRNNQHPKQHTPRRHMQEDPAPNRVATPIPPRSKSVEDDIADEQSDIEAQTESEGSPNLNIRATASVKVVPRTETQLLFEQVVPEIEEDTTIFDLPPPEGGWEQFSDAEDEMEDIHASVEVADHDLPEYRAASTSSETNEAAAEPMSADERRSENRMAEEVLVISDHESEVTTFSGDVESRTPNGTTGVQKQKLPAQSISGGSERTASSSSRTASSRLRDHEEDNTAYSSASSESQGAIESWLSNQSRIHNTISPGIVTRLASTSLQATILNLSAATFTLRDMVASFTRSEATRRAQFQVDTRIKREYADIMSQPKFKPKTSLTEEEARSLLPRDVLGVWTVEDDRDFLSQTVEGLEKVMRKHGAAGVRRRAKFLRVRYGEGAVIVSATPRSRLESARRQR